jgi:hypothetical protein
MGRRTAVIVLTGALAASCGGGSSPATSSSAAPATAGDPSKVVQLDGASFDTTVLAATRPSLVEFHSPT